MRLFALVPSEGGVGWRCEVDEEHDTYRFMGNPCSEGSYSSNLKSNMEHWLRLGQVVELTDMEVEEGL